MATYAPLGSGGYSFDVNREMIDVTSDLPTLDPSWKATDSQGHEHHYDRDRHEYPTLDFIVDASHWCDGTEGIAFHDPHEQIDESHYECKQCREVVEPGLLPAGWRHYIPGMWSGTATGPRSDGWVVTVSLTADEIESVATSEGDERIAVLRSIIETSDRLISQVSR